MRQLCLVKSEQVMIARQLELSNHGSFQRCPLQVARSLMFCRFLYCPLTLCDESIALWSQYRVNIVSHVVVLFASITYCTKAGIERLATLSAILYTTTCRSSGTDSGLMYSSSTFLLICLTIFSCDLLLAALIRATVTPNSA